MEFVRDSKMYANIYYKGEIAGIKCPRKFYSQKQGYRNLTTIAIYPE